MKADEEGIVRITWLNQYLLTIRLFDKDDTLADEVDMRLALPIVKLMLFAHIERRKIYEMESHWQ
jgi:hypothetical protein